MKPAAPQREALDTYSGDRPIAALLLEPLSRAVAEAERTVGEVARQMVTAAPEAILAGEPVPAPGKRRSWKRRRFSRS